MSSKPTPVLYDYWRSSAAYRVRIALGMKGIVWRAVPVDLLAKGHKAPAHLARNPQGLVPVLDIDGLTLTQSVAIVEYLDETRPDPPLLPQDPAGRARVRALAHVIAMDIHPICNASVAAHVVELAGGGETIREAWMQRFIRQGLAAFEKLLDHPATARFSHGDAPGLADICLVPQLYNATRWGVDFACFERISRVAARAAELPAFQAANPEVIGPPPAT
jgi:maleylacetoacetate isomerase